MKTNEDRVMETRRRIKQATGTNTAPRSRSMKPNLDTGVEVYDNKVKKKQRHATNDKTKYVSKYI